MATFIDPLRETTFAQDWTFFYWSFALGWGIATPFFIASISKGRTVKNTILGTYLWGLSGSTLSFIVLGHYGMAQQFIHGADFSGAVKAGASYAEVILQIIDTLPLSNVFLAMLCVAMIVFYSTTFDSLSMVVSSYSHKRLPVGTEPDKRIRAFWSIMFIVLPIARSSPESSMSGSGFASGSKGGRGGEAAPMVKNLLFQIGNGTLCSLFIRNRLCYNSSRIFNFMEKKEKTDAAE